MNNKMVFVISIVLLVLISGLLGFQLGTNLNGGKDMNRYEMIGVNENNLIIFDRKTGEYWRKFIPSSQGPTNWEKEDSPVRK